MRTTIILAAAILTLVFTGESCRKDKSGTAYLKVRMTDSPGNYQQVNVDILTVRAHVVESNGHEGWYDLPTNSGIYNLLALQNGIDTTIVDMGPLPAGTITQMRLVLGPNNSVMVDSIVYHMDTPSGQESGIKLVGNIALPASYVAPVLLDFNAGESIVLTGNGSYQLKPVIKVMP